MADPKTHMSIFKHLHGWQLYPSSPDAVLKLTDCKSKGECKSRKCKYKKERLYCTGEWSQEQSRQNHLINDDKDDEWITPVLDIKHRHDSHMVIE